MKDAAELCRGLLRKAIQERQSCNREKWNEMNPRRLDGGPQELDAACFNAQQITEKCVKGVEFSLEPHDRLGSAFPETTKYRSAKLRKMAAGNGAKLAGYYRSRLEIPMAAGALCRCPPRPLRRGNPSEIAAIILAEYKELQRCAEVEYASPRAAITIASSMKALNSVPSAAYC